MRISKNALWMLILLFTIFLPTGILALITTPAAADDALEAKQLVEKTKISFENIVADPNMEAMTNLIQRAKGVFVAPQVLRGAFVFGASGGSGVFVARDEKTGQWIGPAFYTMGGVSFGLQIGGDASEVILLVMTDRGVTALMASSFKLGADVGITMGPIGVGAEASTANLSADIISFAHSKGLYGGISLKGAVVATRGGLNSAYYGKEVTPSDIFIRQEVKNPQSESLIEAVTKAASRK